jgi:phosphatidylserine/phosphatidylglycerophosphate/cardiolipin synthase-like enzyme
MTRFDNLNLKGLNFPGIAWILPVLVISLGFLAFRNASQTENEVTSPGQVKVAFNKECETMLIDEVSTARNEILVAIFSLTRRNINAALVNAVKRGVRVTLKYDARQEDLEAMKDSIAYLKKHGVKCLPIKFADEHGSMHNKFMVIDRKLVLTGSYNYTVPASVMNYENLVVIESQKTAETFAAEFEKIKDK